jgi:membrane-associated phospholipid phosphatase
VHYPSDVVAGWATGALSAVAVHAVFDALARAGKLPWFSTRSPSSVSAGPGFVAVTIGL